MKELSIGMRMRKRYHECVKDERLGGNVVCLSHASIRFHIPNVNLAFRTRDSKFHGFIRTKLGTENMSLLLYPSELFVLLTQYPQQQQLTNSKFLLATMLGRLSVVFHTLTSLSVLPVAMQLGTTGLTSSALTAPSWAWRVKIALPPAPLATTRTS